MLIAAVALALAPTIGVITGQGCTVSQLQAGLCTYSTQEQVTISGSETLQGSGPQASDDLPRSKSGNGRSPAEPTAPRDCGPLNRCETYTVATVPDLTLADIASFRPTTPTLTGEPAGFGILGMPTNLLATAAEQHIPGTILDWDVTVRFVSTAYIFDHGDGTTTRTTTGGTSWTTLGQAQFTPTATSHTYRQRGTYRVSVTVEYQASVDFGNGHWRPVPGVITAHATGYQVRVVEVRTALVDRTCTQDPTGPGC